MKSKIGILVMGLVIASMLFNILPIKIVMAGKSSYNCEGQTEIVVSTASPSIWVDLICPTQIWYPGANPFKVLGYRHLVACAEYGEKLSGSWVTELFDTQGNRLTWPEEIPFEVYNYPGSNNWKSEVFTSTGGNWYLESGPETITMHCTANWVRYIWDFNENEWVIDDLGHLEASDYSSFTVDYQQGS